MEELERTVIGCLLLEYEQCKGDAADISPEWFEISEYASIMRCIRELEAERITPDAVQIISRLGGECKNAIILCANEVPKTSRFSEYKAELKLHWRERCVRNAINRIACSNDGVEEITEKLREIVKEQDDITATDNKRVGQSFMEAAADFYQQLYTQTSRYLTGYSDFDNIIGGIVPGSVMALAARSGQGKTDFALSLMLRYAASGRKVLYYSMEMTPEQLMIRVASQFTHINNTRIRDKQLTQEECTFISRALGTVEQSGNIRIVQERVGVGRIRSDIKSFAPDIVFIDHLGIMKMPNAYKRVDAVSETTRAIKALALESGIAVVELVQMNREVEKRSNKRPLLSDLKDSGSIEEDADYIVFLQTEKSDRQLKADEAFTTTAYIEKNRHGGTGQTEFAWRPQYSSYSCKSYTGGAI